MIKFSGFLVIENPWLCRGVEKSFSGAYEIKTPFDTIKLRSANC